MTKEPQGVHISDNVVVSRDLSLPRQRLTPYELSSLVIYRHIGDKYYDPLISEGSIALNKIEAFRDPRHDKRSDPTEGHYDIVVDGFPAESSNLGRTLGNVLLPYQNKEHTTAKNNRVIFISQPCYIMCFAMQVQPINMGKFGQLVVIKDLNRFKNAIDQEVMTRYGLAPSVASAVTYLDYTKPPPDTVYRLHPAFKKPQEYATEHEFRLAWPIAPGEAGKLPQVLPMCIEELKDLVIPLSQSYLTTHPLPLTLYDQCTAKYIASSFRPIDLTFPKDLDSVKTSEGVTEQEDVTAQISLISGSPNVQPVDRKIDQSKN
ncbi:MAG: hypothetical protein JJ916_12380 [Phycisphaerales bacterium]|nr:hypothetical protein [Phycisphaerales bacterium]